MLTKYSRELSQESDADDLPLLDNISAPAEEESEHHSGEPRRTGCGAALRQFKSQCFSQVQHQRILIEEQQKEISEVAYDQTDERYGHSYLPYWCFLPPRLFDPHNSRLCAKSNKLNCFTSLIERPIKLIFFTFRLKLHLFFSVIYMLQNTREKQRIIL